MSYKQLILAASIAITGCSEFGGKSMCDLESKDAVITADEITPYFSDNEKSLDRTLNTIRSVYETGMVLDMNHRILGIEKKEGFFGSGVNRKDVTGYSRTPIVINNMGLIAQCYLTSHSEEEGNDTKSMGCMMGIVKYEEENDKTRISLDWSEEHDKPFWFALGSSEKTKPKSFRITTNMPSETDLENLEIGAIFSKEVYVRDNDYAIWGCKVSDNEKKVLTCDDITVCLDSLEAKHKKVIGWYTKLLEDFPNPI